MKLSASSIKKSVKGLCGPALFYLVLSLISLVLYLVNMLEHKNKMNTASGFTIQVVVVMVSGGNIDQKLFNRILSNG